MMFKSKCSEQKALEKALWAEVQAIAIYEAECWLLARTCWTLNRKWSLQSFLRILEEERSHYGWLEAYTGKLAFKEVLLKVNQFSGFVLGSLFAFLPSRLSWKLHFLAEMQAEKIYKSVLKGVKDQQLCALLVAAAEQENAHAMCFYHQHQAIENQ